MASVTAGGTGGVAAPGGTLTDPAGAGPARQRYESLDFVRGVALFGILLMNITAFGLPNAYFSPANAGGAAEGANLWTWIVTSIGFEGTQRGLFSMLFGASAVLLTSRLEAAGRADAADIYFRRNLWLIGFGLVNAFVFLWYGDILYAYGICALFLFVFRRVEGRRLLALGGAVLLLATVWNGWDTWDMLAKHEAYEAAGAARAAGAALSTEQQEALEAWPGVEAMFVASEEANAESVAALTTGWWNAFAYVASNNAHWQSWGMYRYFFDIFGMMLIGMGLYRLGVLTLERPTRLYVAMAAIGYAVGLTVNVAEARWVMAHDYSAVAFAEANVTYDLGRLAMTIGHLGALLLFVRSGALGWLRRSVAAVGQMAVTNYLMHSVLCGILFIGLGYYGQLERYQLYYVVLAIWAAQLVISPLWLRHYRFGPVEWLWRYLTYMKRPPMRHTAVPVTAVAS